MLVDSEYFLELYGNSTDAHHALSDARCARMFKKIQSKAWEATCGQNGTEDFLRRVPCPLGGMCPDEDSPKNLVAGSQLTFRISNLRQPRYVGNYCNAWVGLSARAQEHD